jgi:hypothetical protein
MNRNKLKTYAPEARRDFIQAMKDRAAFYGLTASKIEPAVVRGDVAVIAGRDHPRAIADKRKKLEARVQRNGFEQTMEAMAYTWFNRLVAIRFMELHGYLDHGYRVLSHPEGKQTPEILEHAEHVELPGLKKDRAIDLKLEGNRESELYRLLLTAQCNALHKAMPFLFERIDDETELLLPDNLLHSDSLVRKLVDGIDEADWKEVEIIGWLYQFYISEKKAEVIGKVVASADIPAATQLFTPNWIVKYLVQNTLGRQWLASYPNSALRAQMEYYIEPVEQTPEVANQINAITPQSLDPEALTMLDPACGSCHILVEGYDLFKAIYLERGYRLRDIPALILQKNLFGFEIDDRAAQLGAFALMMKARADDRRIFDVDVKPNVLAFQESNDLDAPGITTALNAPFRRDSKSQEYLFAEIDDAETPLLARKTSTNQQQISQADIDLLLATFKNAKALGSLLRVPDELKGKLQQIEQRLDEVATSGDLTFIAAQVIRPLIHQAKLLDRKYDVVVANPPYLNNKAMNTQLKEFLSANYAYGKTDLFAAFLLRAFDSAKQNGFVSFMTPFVWLSISSFKDLREYVLTQKCLLSLIQPEYHAFFDSAFVPICAFTIRNLALQVSARFIDLSSFYGADVQPVKAKEAIRNQSCGWHYVASASDFVRLPDMPIAFMLRPAFFALGARSDLMGALADVREGINTGDNDRFLRLWQEVAWDEIVLSSESASEAATSSKKWFPHNKGGGIRRWYGNNEYVVNWQNDGYEIRNFKNDAGKLLSAIRGVQHFFKPGLTWSSVGSSGFAARAFGPGFTFNSTGRCLFPHQSDKYILGLLNSAVASEYLRVIAPTLSFTVGNIASVPVITMTDARSQEVDENVTEMIKISHFDWNLSETSWEFEGDPIVLSRNGLNRVKDSYTAFQNRCRSDVARMRILEEANNRLFIETYELTGDLSSDFTDDKITLHSPDPADSVKKLLSYIIGCIMGRYSLDNVGLTYASSENRTFDKAKYNTFPADDDGIISLLNADWGARDDAARRVIDFVSTAWPEKHLEENIKFIADELGTNSGEQPRDTIRRYLANGFYKYHLSLYKKRPIYWLFSSGKHRAFQCLVYLHRYNEGTLARVRTEYVIPLQGQIEARIDQIEGEKVNATGTSHRKKLQKEQDDLKKQRTELVIFEEKLKHFADQRIKLNLDDGVKINYGKFGDLLAEVKAITGGKDGV